MLIAEGMGLRIERIWPLKQKGKKVIRVNIWIT